MNNLKIGLFGLLLVFFGVAFSQTSDLGNWWSTPSSNVNINSSNSVSTGSNLPLNNIVANNPVSVSSSVGLLPQDDKNSNYFFRSRAKNKYKKKKIVYSIRQNKIFSIVTAQVVGLSKSKEGDFSIIMENNGNYIKYNSIYKPMVKNNQIVFKNVCIGVSNKKTS